jgi:hypothetical protein
MPAVRAEESAAPVKIRLTRGITLGPWATHGSGVPKAICDAPAMAAASRRMSMMAVETRKRVRTVGNATD